MTQNYFTLELRRAFLSKNTLISFALILLCLFIGASEYIFNHYPSTNALYLFMFAHSKGTMAIISLVFPILVSLPFATSYVIDSQSGYLNYVMLRMNRGKYLCIRLMVNAIVSGIVFAGSFVLAFIFFLVLKNFDITKPNNLEVSLLNSILNQSPLLFVFILILNCFVCGVVFSTFALGISTILKNKYLTIIAPFAFYLLSGTLLTQINKYFNAAMLFDLGYYPDMRWSYVIIYYLILLAVGVGTFFIGAIKNEE